MMHAYNDANLLFEDVRERIGCLCLYIKWIQDVVRYSTQLLVH